MPKKVWEESVGIDKYFNSLYNGGNYLSMLAFKLKHISKRGPWPQCVQLDVYIQRHNVNEASLPIKRTLEAENSMRYDTILVTFFLNHL